MRVGLFIPCYVDAAFPQVGVASWKLLRHLGIDVTYPKGQTCCGQPMANGGFENKAVPLALKFERLFRDYDYVVTPSVEELRKRLIARATDPMDAIETRVAKAAEEMTYAPQFDKVLINDDLETAYREAEALVDAFLGA